MSKIAGGCLCGNVRYTSEAEPNFIAVCHCKDCPRATGAASAIVVSVPKESLEIEAKNLGQFTVTGYSGKPVTRHFCRDCGSSICGEPAIVPDVLMINAGTLDDTSWVKPEVNIWCDSAQPWVEMGENLPRFEKNPPLEA